MTPVFLSPRNGLYFDPTFSRNRYSNSTSKNLLIFTTYVLLMGPVPSNSPSSTSVSIRWTGPPSFFHMTPSNPISAIAVEDSRPLMIIVIFSDWCAPLSTYGRSLGRIFARRWKPGIMAFSTTSPLPSFRLISTLRSRKCYNYFPPCPRRLFSLHRHTLPWIPSITVSGPSFNRILGSPLGTPFSRVQSYKVSSPGPLERRCCGTPTIILSSSPPLPSWNGRRWPLRNWLHVSFLNQQGPFRQFLPPLRDLQSRPPQALPTLWIYL